MCVSVYVAADSTQPPDYLQTASLTPPPTPHPFVVPPTLRSRASRAAVNPQQTPHSLLGPALHPQPSHPTPEFSGQLMLPWWASEGWGKVKEGGACHPKQTHCTHFFSALRTPSSSTGSPTSLSPAVSLSEQHDTHTLTVTVPLPHTSAQWGSLQCPMLTQPRHALCQAEVTRSQLDAGLPRSDTHNNVRTHFMHPTCTRHWL